MTFHGWREPPELEEDEVHLWWGRMRAESSPSAPETAHWLSSEEEARAARFHREVHAGRFRARRTFLRGVLALYLEASPGDLRFQTGKHGKPFLVPASGLEFNLSHTGDLVLIGVGRREIGVDVERHRVKTSLDRLAEQVLSEGELTSFFELPEECRLDRFFRIWTRKEALLKVLGVGLSRDPRSFTVGFQERAPGEVWAPDSPAPIGRLGLLDLDAEEHDVAACVSATGTCWNARVVARVELG